MSSQPLRGSRKANPARARSLGGGEANISVSGLDTDDPIRTTAPGSARSKGRVRGDLFSRGMPPGYDGFRPDIPNSRVLTIKLGARVSWNLSE